MLAGKNGHMDCVKTLLEAEASITEYMLRMEQFVSLNILIINNLLPYFLVK